MSECKQEKEYEPEINCRDPSAPSTGNAAHNLQGKPQRDLLGNVVTFSRVKSPPMLESERHDEFCNHIFNIFDKGAPCIQLEDILPPP